MKVTASAEQSYSYYSGNDGTDKDPQVVKSPYENTCYDMLTLFCPCCLCYAHQISSVVYSW